MIDLLVKMELISFVFSLNKMIYFNRQRIDWNEMLIKDRFDCLRISFGNEKKEIREKNFFCFDEFSLKKIFSIEENRIDQQITFEELYLNRITIDELSQWSTTIDQIESYQIYFQQRNISSLSIRNEIYFNCSSTLTSTSKRFGHSCEYSLLIESIDEYYREENENLDEITCYLGLKCDRGSNGSCLDWTEICDGYVDCLNDQIDEIHCWNLEMNQCDEINEYRCSNGQCIPKQFYLDEFDQSECLDRSDQRKRNDFYLNSIIRYPTITNEDIQCRHRHWNFNVKLTSSCQRKRNLFLTKLVYQTIPSGLSFYCWMSFKCSQFINFPFDNHCLNICSTENSCEDLFLHECPSELIVPSSPLLFGHIYFLFDKNDLFNSIPFQRLSWICFDEQYCLDPLINSSSSSSLRFYKHLKCRNSKDLSIKYPTGGRFDFLSSQLIGIYSSFHQCNTILYPNRSICDQMKMYQCRNSMKCLTKDRLCDGMIDCDEHDDERCSINDIDNRCFLDEFVQLFRCEISRKCLSKKRIDDGQCDCFISSQNICEDEFFDSCREDHFYLCQGKDFQQFIEKHLSFYTICDGSTELKPIIDQLNRTHSDETDCQLFHCDNLYTHCDGFWNCLDGHDEINCSNSSLITTNSLIQCPINHHQCVLPLSYRLSCLSIDKFNDGTIDCVGATDELNLCRSISSHLGEKTFFCQEKFIDRCIETSNLCSIRNQCFYGDDSLICNRTRSESRLFCQYSSTSNILSSSEAFLCQHSTNQIKSKLKYFRIHQQTTTTMTTTTRRGEEEKEKKIVLINKWNCHRGFPINIWSNRYRNESIVGCLCPASYYGERCEYQNERLSLTLKINTKSHSRRTHLTLILKLIERNKINENDLRIHSFDRLNYLYVRDCQKIFNIYFHYENHQKDLFNEYFLQIDIYQTKDLNYRTSFIYLIKENYLPVNRLAIDLLIPHQDEQQLNINSMKSCRCLHGRCLFYFNGNSLKTNEFFCQCDRNWKGSMCQIPFHCQCSTDSLCLGETSITNRSICLCPIDRLGEKCFIPNNKCFSKEKEKEKEKEKNWCLNDGECLPSELDEKKEKNYCLCQRGFSGERCERIDHHLRIEFDRKIKLSSFILIHLIEMRTNDWSLNGSTYKNIYPYTRSIDLHWSRLFHLVFIQMLTNDIYLIYLDKTNEQMKIKTNENRSSMNLFERVNREDRCLLFNEFVNQTIVSSHLIYRMKFYHWICEKYFEKEKKHLKCFYDENSFCYCFDFNGKSLSNCFQFNKSFNANCFGQSNCQNGGKCLQDRSICPQTSICLCEKCFHGDRCQFQSNFFGLTLDAILGYQIEPKKNIFSQSSFIRISIFIFTLIIFCGFINGILSIFSFENHQIRQSGCGYYLLTISFFNLILMIFLFLKFWILILTQIGQIRNKTFLTFQCRYLDWILHSLIPMDRWLSCFISIERVLTLIKGSTFNQKKSIRISQWIIPFSSIFILLSNSFDPFYRQLLIDWNDENLFNNRYWCITTYSKRIQMLNSIINLFHHLIPFLIQMICSIYFLIRLTKRRTSFDRNRSYREIFIQQIQKHFHLILSPLIFVLLSLPRFIIYFQSTCMKSLDDSTLPLIGYLFSYFPSILTFPVFVLPSKFYKTQLRNRFNSYQRSFSLRIQQFNNTIRF